MESLERTKKPGGNMSQNKETTAAAARPLSPHLQVYRWQMTMSLSILHRITGVILSFGCILLTGWLWAAAYNAECYNGIVALIRTPLGIAFLIAWSLCFYYHFCNGIRHLFWDMGYGFEIKAAYKSGYTVLIGTALLTAMTWLCIYSRSFESHFN